MSTQEIESNNSTQTSNLSFIGQVIEGQINANNDIDYFKVQIVQGGILSLDFTHPNGAGTAGRSISVKLIDSDGTVIVSNNFAGNDQLIGTVPTSGNYFVSISDNDITSSYQAGIYSLATSFISTPTSAYDGGDNNATTTAIDKLADGATTLKTGNSITGSIGANDDIDYFKVQIEQGGILTLGFTHPNGAGTAGRGILVKLIDSDGTVIVSNNFTGNGQLIGTVPTSGNYFVSISDNSTSSYQAGIYEISFFTAINGTDAAESITGTSGKDSIFGLAGNDHIHPGLGNDSIDGGQGIDTVNYQQPHASSSIVATSTGWTVNGPDGTDTLTNIERLQFSDVRVALDLNGHSGSVAKILGAVFGSESIHNKEYVGIGLFLMDDGMSYEDLCALAVSAAGKAAHGDVVDLLWNNVIGTPITLADKAYLVGLLDGGMSIGSLTALAADTSFNTDNIGLVGLAQTGLEFVPFGG